MKSTSKNARKAPVTGAYTEVGEISRFAVLGDDYCYIFDPRDGRTHHLRVGSEPFWQVVADIEEKAGLDRMVKEVHKYAVDYPESRWPQVSVMLNARAGERQAA